MDIPSYCDPRILGHEGTCMCGYVSMDSPWTSPVTVPPRILGHEGTCMCGYRCVSMDGPWTSPVTVPSTDTRTRGYMYVWV